MANYLEWPEALCVLRDELFAEDHRQPIALTALTGMGGIGKTVLAKAVTEDEVVQRAFPGRHRLDHRWQGAQARLHRGDA